MKYVTLTQFQMFLLALITGVLGGLITVGYTMYTEYRLLPTVVQDGNGQCIKVVNYENGHAFACPDVNVVLRRYRTQVEIVK